ncbi:hypothetical protein, partial [Parapedobacter pyrenivorans]|uniref:hypothetical protein n=1 Tax=Parapedobacter pyrenivorans TaxID=1305674 RepID=UPI00334239B4
SYQHASIKQLADITRVLESSSGTVWFFLTFDDMGGFVTSASATRSNGDPVTIYSCIGTISKTLSGGYLFSGQIDCSAGQFHFSDAELNN